MTDKMNNIMLAVDEDDLLRIEELVLNVLRENIEEHEKEAKEILKIVEICLKGANITKLLRDLTKE